MSFRGGQANATPTNGTPPKASSRSARPATIAIKAALSQRNPFRRSSSKSSGRHKKQVAEVPATPPPAVCVSPPNGTCRRPLPELRIQLSEDNDAWSSSCYSSTPESPQLFQALSATSGAADTYPDTSVTIVHSTPANATITGAAAHHANIDGVSTNAAVSSHKQDFTITVSMPLSGSGTPLSTLCPNNTGSTSSNVQVTVENAPVKDSFPMKNHAPLERKRADSCVVPLQSEWIRADSCTIQLPGTEQDSLIPTTGMQSSHSEQFNLTCEAFEVSLMPNRNVLHKSYSEILHATKGVLKVEEDVMEEHTRPRSRSYCSGIDTRRASQCSSILQQGSSKTLLTVPSLTDLLEKRVSVPSEGYY